MLFALCAQLRLVGPCVHYWCVSIGNATGDADADLADTMFDAPSRFPSSAGCFIRWSMMRGIHSVSPSSVSSYSRAIVASSTPQSERINATRTPVRSFPAVQWIRHACGGDGGDGDDDDDDEIGADPEELGAPEARCSRMVR